jgi:hypothetical protein
MKTIIAGSRNITSYEVVLNAIETASFDITEVVSGTAKGVDSLGEQFAKDCNLPIKRFPADWDQYGKSAGFIRNTEMARYAEALIAIWDGTSSGTKHIITEANKYGLEIHISIV